VYSAILTPIATEPTKEKKETSHQGRNPTQGQKAGKQAQGRSGPFLIIKKEGGVSYQRGGGKGGGKPGGTGGNRGGTKPSLVGLPTKHRSKQLEKAGVRGAKNPVWGLGKNCIGE